ncbi:putative Atrial natriuretic peptide receptor 2 [Hypsibius exemplaris]|uniref:Atrial natriuretic peptide receptor 2 n=1 Tax=Hypsibius exemplaris TaxID=2072580 RepID=A0A1W0WNK6_HYPEX|nr:putative Atrial natriuretic peptide receptor 2 [Hypsibius exemplaris]
MNDEYLRRYNWTMDPRDQNPYAPVRILEWMLIVAQNFKESLEDLHGIDAEAFVRRCTNRTYQTELRTAFMNQNGALVAPITISRVNAQGAIAPYLVWDVESNSVTFTATNASWFGWSSLPAEIPLCGLHNELCPSHLDMQIAVGVTWLIIALSGPFIRRYIRLKVLHSRLAHLLIDHKKVIITDQQGSVTVEKIPLLQLSDTNLSGICLLNDRYTIRVALAGFQRLTSKLQARGERSGFRRLFFPAKKDITTSEYQQNDIRAIGLIMQEMFGDQTVKKDNQSVANRMERDVETLMRSCLDQNPSNRPTSSSLQKRATSLKFASRSVVELLMHRIQTHAETLEQEVALRTDELIEEMKKVDDLLKEMLPIGIIQKLRNQEAIEAELFESGTILFSDIPAFSHLVSQYTPNEVLAFLSQIHSMFDLVVADFDAYKVETINDSYVVASGIPQRNGERHALEVCKLAVRLRIAGASVTVSAAADIVVCPRIGINSGLVAAGVVGTRMPRYCLDLMVTAMASSDNDSLKFTSRGLITIKGKGQVETFWLRGLEKPIH